jgi:hypothetical protein
MGCFKPEEIVSVNGICRLHRDSHSTLAPECRSKAATTVKPYGTVSNCEQFLPRPEAYSFFAVLSSRALNRRKS